MCINDRMRDSCRGGIPRTTKGLCPKILREAGRVGRLYCPRGSAPSSLLFLQRGASLIELIMFIVIVSAALAGILLVLNQATRGSVDPLLRKQSIAAAYSLLDEVELQSFANPTGGFSGAATQANRAQFDDVMDYNGLLTNGIFTLSGTTAIAGLEKYQVRVAVVPETAAWNGIPAGSVVQINVTVTAPNGDAVTATGYRTAY